MAKDLKVMAASHNSMVGNIIQEILNGGLPTETLRLIAAIVLTGKELAIGQRTGAPPPVPSVRDLHPDPTPWDTRFLAFEPDSDKLSSPPPKKRRGKRQALNCTGQ